MGERSILTEILKIVGVEGPVMWKPLGARGMVGTEADEEALVNQRVKEAELKQTTGSQIVKK